MSLREQFNEDNQIFFDADEMATLHLIQDRTLLVVVDNDQLQKNALQVQGGVYAGDLLLYVKTADLTGLRVAADALITFDKRPYVIASLLEEDGVTQLVLQAAKGGY